MTFKQLAIITLCAATSFPSFADKSDSSPIHIEADLSNNAYITRIETRDSGIHSIYIEGGFANNVDGCDLTDRAVFDETAVAGGKSMLALAISASLAGKQIRINTDGCIDIAGSAGITAPKAINLKMTISRI